MKVFEVEETVKRGDIFKDFMTKIILFDILPSQVGLLKQKLAVKYGSYYNLQCKVHCTSLYSTTVSIISITCNLQPKLGLIKEVNSVT